MSNKMILAALAAVATLGVSMLAPSSASAFGFHGGGARAGGFGHGGGVHVNFRGPSFVRGPGFNRFPHFHPHWHVGYRRPIWYAAPVIAAPVSYAVSRPAAAGACTCLTKEYTPDGRVLFKDRCTNEAAINPPIATEAPVQQSSLQVPQDTGTYQAQPQNMMAQQPIPQAQ